MDISIQLKFFRRDFLIKTYFSFRNFNFEWQNFATFSNTSLHRFSSVLCPTDEGGRKYRSFCAIIIEMGASLQHNWIVSIYHLFSDRISLVFLKNIYSCAFAIFLTYPYWSFSFVDGNLIKKQSQDLWCYDVIGLIIIVFWTLTPTSPSPHTLPIYRSQ